MINIVLLRICYYKQLCLISPFLLLTHCGGVSVSGRLRTKHAPEVRGVSRETQHSRMCAKKSNPLCDETAFTHLYNMMCGSGR